MGITKFTVYVYIGTELKSYSDQLLFFLPIHWPSLLLIWKYFIFLFQPQKENRFNFNEINSISQLNNGPTLINRQRTSYLHRGRKMCSLKHLRYQNLKIFPFGPNHGGPSRRHSWWKSCRYLKFEPDPPLLNNVVIVVPRRLYLEDIFLSIFMQ